MTEYDSDGGDFMFLRYSTVLGNSRFKSRWSFLATLGNALYTFWSCGMGDDGTTKGSYLGSFPGLMSTSLFTIGS